MSAPPRERATPPTLSLIISTLGRSGEIIPLLESLAAQTLAPVQIIIVDQNKDDRVGAALSSLTLGLPITHLRTPDEVGLSVGRNAGLALATGDYVLFPDDDCWYPADFLDRAASIATAKSADIVSGRAADPVTLASINGRFEAAAQPITRDNVWTTSIEWVVLFRRSALQAAGGYDPGIGVGAATPWQAAEGQDAILRCLEAGFSGYYDPGLFAHHAVFDTSDPGPQMRLKGRRYARGMGHVLRRHGFSPAAALYWTARPAAQVALNLARLKPRRAAYFANVAIGRLEGYAGHTLGAG